QSLERFLNLRYPLSILDVQRTLAVCMEDGAAAVILALDKRTLDEQALQAVNIDVLGCSDTGSDEKRTRDFAARFGCVIGKHTHIARRTSESDLLAAQASSAYDESDAGALSLSIAMVLAAGVRKANIKSALRVSRDMQ
ncbi:MAG TPA: UDP-N-acetylmuramyl peptide synthase, partial [Bifidobacterium sp.]|nr:UDP-N-acetylmuramyl peptide synthase [Bifidobacterium sp.]